MAFTARLALPYPDGGDPPNIPVDMSELASALDTAAVDSQGLLAARPAATTSGRYYTATDDLSGGANGTTYRADGTAWRRISDQVMQGTLAARPAAATSNIGVLYYASDIGSFFVSTGSDWTQNPVPQCFVYANATQSIPNGTGTAIAFAAEAMDLGTPSLNMHDNVTNNTRITIRVSGLYALTATASFSANATGFRTVYISANVGAVAGACTQIPAAIGGAGTNINASTIVRYSAGDYIEAFAIQGSGGPLLTSVTGGSSTSAMSAVWLGP
jgi:hypothetical protein